MFPEHFKLVVQKFWRCFGNKFSFVQELLRAINGMRDKNKEIIGYLEEVKEKEESAVIRKINVEKMKLTAVEEEKYSLIYRYLCEYNKADKLLYKEDHKVEKGDRLY